MKASTWLKMVKVLAEAGYTEKEVAEFNRLSTPEFRRLKAYHYSTEEKLKGCNSNHIIPEIVTKTANKIVDCSRKTSS